jgi:hypothetical protein
MKYQASSTPTSFSALSMFNDLETSNTMAEYEFYVLDPKLTGKYKFFI